MKTRSQTRLAKHHSSVYHHLTSMNATAQPLPSCSSCITDEEAAHILLLLQNKRNQIRNKRVSLLKKET